MEKGLLLQRLRIAIGYDVSAFAFAYFVGCFALHAHYLARFFNFDTSRVRPPNKLRLAHEFTALEVRLFCIYCGYDLTSEHPTPLW